jgi:hypothetical protein
VTWIEIARPPYVTDVVRCSSCGMTIPARYWDAGEGLTNPYCSPACLELEARVSALRERYGGGSPFPSRAGVCRPVAERYYERSKE